MALLRFFKRLGRIFGLGGNGTTIGIYGAPNAGKTQLANTMCRDWDGDVRGSVSDVPHETRGLETRQQVVLKSAEGTVTLDVMDTPGISSHVSLVELEAIYGMSPDEARRRAEEAMNGMLEALRAVDRLTGILLVLDATQDPLRQVNQVLLANARARNVKVIVVANKVDLPQADVAYVRKVFSHHPVVPVSALKGKGMDDLYAAIIREFS